jgi:isopentenyldiphosphate isomerase
MASTEIVDIVDENNVVVGSLDVDSAHAQKLIHRVVGVFVFDTNGNLFLQKGNKYEKYDLSVGGHVQKGETYENAARREMLEEIGLSTPLRHIATFLPSETKLNHYWAIFTTTAPDSWEFKPTEEVSSLERMSMEKVQEMIQMNPDVCTHGLLNTMKEFIRIKQI